MTIGEANQDFLEKIYTKCGVRTTRLITSLQIGSNGPKDMYKHIMALYYVNLLEEFSGTYTPIMCERTLYPVVKFLEDYFKITFLYGFEYIKAKMAEWILTYGVWDDKLFWVDSEFWND